MGFRCGATTVELERRPSKVATADVPQRSVDSVARLVIMETFGHLNWLGRIGLS